MQKLIKFLSIEELPELPIDIKNLIADGIHSFFEIEGDEAKYLLHTEQSKEHYLLSEDGKIVRSGNGPGTLLFTILRAATFSNLADNRVRINL